MKLAVYLTPLSEENLALAAQAGATDIVAPYPGLNPQDLLNQKKMIESFGLKFSAIERLIPHLDIVHNRPGRDKQVEGFKQLIKNMGEAGIPVLCYNWMPDDDWQRTDLSTAERGGATTTAFDLNKASSVPTDTGYDAPVNSGHFTSEEDLWTNLEVFLNEVVPVAEASGVKLAIHPDDPPIPSHRGQARIITTVENFEKVVHLVKSPANGICFCQGTMASKPNMNIPEAIEKLAPYIHYIHFRDVVGEVPQFRESFIDNGKTDMAECMKKYIECGIKEDVPIRPDHVPTMEGEDDANPGYRTLGRLHALGYMKGLIDGVKVS